MRHVLSQNPHPISTPEARAWEDGYWAGRRDVVAQGRPAIRGCSDCETMSHCESHHKEDGTYPADPT